MNVDEAANYSDNGAHNLTAEERSQGLNGVRPETQAVLPHRLTNNSNNR